VVGTPSDSALAGSYEKHNMTSPAIHGGVQEELKKQAAQLPSLPESKSYPCAAINKPGYNSCPD